MNEIEQLKAENEIILSEQENKQLIENLGIRENERNIYRAGRMSLAINILGLLDIEDAEYENTQS